MIIETGRSKIKTDTAETRRERDKGGQTPAQKDKINCFNNYQLHLQCINFLCQLKLSWLNCYYYSVLIAKTNVYLASSNVINQRGADLLVTAGYTSQAFMVKIKYKIFYL